DRGRVPPQRTRDIGHGGALRMRLPVIVGVAPHRPPVPVLPVKSVRPGLCGFQLKELAWRPGARLALRSPFDVRYHERAFVFGIGKWANECSNAGFGWPGEVPPAPLSNRMRIDGRRSNAFSALWYVGFAWIGSGGIVTPGIPMASW